MQVITDATSDRLVIGRVMEGLLVHFFSPDRPIYANEDVLWFLEFTNEQEQLALSTSMVVLSIDGMEETEVNWYVRGYHNFMQYII